MHDKPCLATCLSSIHTGLQVLRALIENYASEAGGREVASLVSDLLPILIDKAGDNNTRIRCELWHDCSQCMPIFNSDVGA